MFEQIMAEVRYIRKRLDDHISDEETDFKDIRKDISSIQSQMEGHKTRLGIMTSGIAAVVTAVVSWFEYQFHK